MTTNIWLHPFRVLLLAVLCVTAALGGGAPKVPAEGLTPAPAGSFSVIALPDTQQYSHERPDVFYQETQWIADNLETQRIAFVTHVGDIVDDDVEAEWQVADRAISKLDGATPYGLGVGNHDVFKPTGEAALFRKKFPASRYEKYPWYGGSYPAGANTSSHQFFEAEGIKFLALHLICNAPDDVLTWARGVLEAHADRRAIVTTHMFLGPIELPPTRAAFFTAENGIMRWGKVFGPRGNSPQQIWDKLLSRHENVTLILSGDQSKAQSLRKTLTGIHGNRVQAMMSDYRDGYLRIYRFLPQQNRIRVMTYSAGSKRLCVGTERAPDPASHQFTVPYEMGP